MVGIVKKKSTADAQILIFKIEKNIYRHVAMVGIVKKNQPQMRKF